MASDVALPLEFIYNHEADSWDGRHEEILADMPGGDDFRNLVNDATVPDGTPVWIAMSYRYPLLTADQEKHLFRRMNYCKMLVNRLTEGRSGPLPRGPSGSQARSYYAQALADQGVIAESNIRLVIKLVKTKFNGRSFLDMLSEGNLALVKAVTKFDYSLGFKFSTYAGNAIVRNCLRAVVVADRHDDRWASRDDLIYLLEDRAKPVDLDKLDEIAVVMERLNRLRRRDREIVKFRVGINGPSPSGRSDWTLDEVGAVFGITKERVRQLYHKAIEKLALPA